MIVLDASVAVAWFLPEPHADFAAGLVGAGIDLTAPDLIVPEVANALVKAFRRGAISQARVAAAVQQMANGIVQLHASAAMLSDAADLACRFRCSAYDATYIELARRRAAAIVTDDARLAEVARSVGIRAHRPADGSLPGFA